MEMQGAVGIDCETVDGGDTFADDRVVDWSLEAFGGGNVFAAARIVGVGHEVIDGDKVRVVEGK